MPTQTSRERPVDGVEQRREHRLEDRRDGVDQPPDAVDVAADRVAADYWRGRT